MNAQDLSRRVVDCSTGLETASDGRFSAAVQFICIRAFGRTSFLPVLAALILLSGGFGHPLMAQDQPASDTPGLSVDDIGGEQALDQLVPDNWQISEDDNGADHQVWDHAEGRSEGQGEATDEEGVEQDGWRFWGGNILNTHSSFTEHTLRPDNVGGLTVKWAFTTGGDVSATPTVEDGALYVPDFAGNLFKIDTQTGTAIWTKRISDYTGNLKSFSRTSPAIAEDKIIIGDQVSGTVLAINKDTGDLVWKTVADPHPAAIITSSPVVFRGRVYVGISSREELFSLIIPHYKLSFRGSVKALDLETGAVIWTTRTVPSGYTGGAVWGSNFAVDVNRGTLYAGTGNNYSVPAGVASCVKAATSVESQLACLDPNDFVDSVLSLSLEDGSIQWGRRLQGADTFLITCVVKPNHGIPCPDPQGPDYDIGSGPNLFTISKHGHGEDNGADRGEDRDGRIDVVGAGQKSGVYWALNADNGDVLWATQVGPGGFFGGIEWGSAVDDRRIYVAIDDDGHVPYTLAPDHTVPVNAGSWAALDPATGEILWQIAATGRDARNPAFAAAALGQVSAANGVVYAGSMSGDMVAMDAESGNILWTFASGGSVVCGPSIVDGTIYWGSGYKNLSRGTTNNKLYAFTVEEGDSE